MSDVYVMGIDMIKFGRYPEKTVPGLGAEAALLEAAYGVTERGNWEGHNILTRTRDDTSLAAEFERPREEIAQSLAQARMKLLRSRDERPQPGRDDKVLTSWNGLMIAAYADAGRALAEPTFTRIATEAADFILRELRTADGRLLRSWKDSRAQHAAVLEDHAHLADGLLALYEATFEERFFVAARELADLVLEHFAAQDGGFYDTADDAEALVARPRSLQDNALPSGGAMATLVLIRLAALTGDGRYRSAAEQALGPLTKVATQHPGAFAQWLLAYQLASYPIDELAIVSRAGTTGDAEEDTDARDETSTDTEAMLSIAFGRYRPAQVVAVSADPDGSAIPLLHARDALDGAATAYVCRDFACQRPTTDPDVLAGQLATASS